MLPSYQSKTCYPLYIYTYNIYNIQMRHFSLLYYTNITKKGTTFAVPNEKIIIFCNLVLVSMPPQTNLLNQLLL